MNLELILAAIGAVTVALLGAAVLFFTVTTLWDRIRSGRWWWDELADGLESGQ